MLFGTVASLSSQCKILHSFSLCGTQEHCPAKDTTHRPQFCSPKRSNASPASWVCVGQSICIAGTSKGRRHLLQIRFASHVPQKSLEHIMPFRAAREPKRFCHFWCHRSCTRSRITSSSSLSRTSMLPHSRLHTKARSSQRPFVQSSS